jgi:hypothetical protein
MQCTLERRLANPYYDCDYSTIPLPPCGNACDYCLGNIARHLSCVIHVMLQKALVDIFLDPDSIDQLTLLDNTFVAALRNYPNAQAAFFASKAEGKPSNKETKTIVLMLLAVIMHTWTLALLSLHATNLLPLPALHWMQNIILVSMIMQSGTACHSMMAFSQALCK